MTYVILEKKDNYVEGSKYSTGCSGIVGHMLSLMP